MKSHRIVVAITGASGTIYGIRALEILSELGVETHLILSRAARITMELETDWTTTRLEKLASACYTEDDIAASVASGSFPTHGMVVVPCSIKTLSAIANCYSQNLIVRAADVTLKERRPLVLVIREAPLHRGHIHLLDLATRSGAIIFPPMPVLYGKPRTVKEMIDSTIGRVLKCLGIENEFYTHWEGR